MNNKNPQNSCEYGIIMIQIYLITCVAVWPTFTPLTIVTSVTVDRRSTPIVFAIIHCCTYGVSYSIVLEGENTQFASLSFTI